VGITVRGTYFPPDAKPKLGERKLFLAIESLHERGLTLAKSEISRIIKEEISKLVSLSGTRWLLVCLRFRSILIHFDSRIRPRS
jgi:hypothetical protein